MLTGNERITFLSPDLYNLLNLHTQTEAARNDDNVWSRQVFLISYRVIFVLLCYSVGLIIFFLFSKDVVIGSNKENVPRDVTVGKEVTDSDDDRAVYDVRNYVILRDLGVMLLQFTRDLGHVFR